MTFTLIHQEEPVGWLHPSEVTRTRIRGKRNLVRGIRVIRVRVNRVKMTENGCQIQGKLDLVRISREFELSEFEISGSYCTGIYSLKNYDEKIEYFMENACVRYLPTLTRFLYHKSNSFAVLTRSISDSEQLVRMVNTVHPHFP